MLDTITKNPVPAALVGLGMYWLLKGPSERQQKLYGEPYRRYPNQDYGMVAGDNLEGRMKEGMQTVQEGYHSVKDQVQEHVTDWKERAGHQTQQWKEQAAYQAQQWKEQATEKAHLWKEETGQKIEEVKGYIHEQSQMARNEFSSLMEKNPLAVGAVMLALGAAVAAALPGSRREDQWMGRSRDKMIDAVKTTVQSAVEDVTQKTEQAAEKAVKREDERDV